VKNNIDEKVVSDFGREWTAFDQSDVPEQELHRQFKQYFSLFPFKDIPAQAQGFDLGCGSGRWAKFVAPKIGSLHCIDPSEQSLNVARKNLSDHENCHFYQAAVNEMPLQDGSMDFGYSLGVLHHTSNIGAGIKKCVLKLKPGAPLLLYIYYAFDNRPLWFKLIWKLSDVLRRLISITPYPVKFIICQLIAVFLYFPLARSILTLEKLGMTVDGIPLSAYRDKSFYTMRTDALDRFGTRREQRFTQTQIKEMMKAAGLENIKFRNNEPYWCALGYRVH